MGDRTAQPAELMFGVGMAIDPGNVLKDVIVISADRKLSHFLLAHSCLSAKRGENSGYERLLAFLQPALPASEMSASKRTGQ